MAIYNGGIYSRGDVRIYYLVQQLRSQMLCLQYGNVYLCNIDQVSILGMPFPRFSRGIILPYASCRAWNRTTGILLYSILRSFLIVVAAVVVVVFVAVVVVVGAVAV